MLIDSAWSQVLATALFHFMWQGLVIGAVVALALRLAAGGTSQTRYLIALIGLAACVVVPGVTAAYLAMDPVATRATELPVSLLGGAVLWTQSMLVDRQGGWPAVAGVRLEDIALYLWLAGLAAGSLRLLMQYAGYQWLKRGGLDSPPLPLKGLVRSLAVDLGITRRVQVVLSRRVDSPLTLGWVRPLILLPMAAWVGLPPAELRLLLVHELAHIRRFDFLINLLQQAVVTVLFYHPVVHWLARRIDEEREACCDEVVLAHDTGAGIDYARALLRLQEQYQAAARRAPSGASLAMAARGGNLLRRIRRVLLVQPVAHAGYTLPGPALVLLGGLLLVGSLSHATLARALWAPRAAGDSVAGQQQDGISAARQQVHYLLDRVLREVDAANREAKSRLQQDRTKSPVERSDSAPRRQADAVPASGEGIDDVAESGSLGGDTDAASGPATPVLISAAIHQFASIARASDPLFQIGIESTMDRETTEQTPAGPIGESGGATDSAAVVTRTTMAEAAPLPAGGSQSQTVTSLPPLDSVATLRAPRLLSSEAPRYPVDITHRGRVIRVRLLYQVLADGSVGRIEPDEASLEHTRYVNAASDALRKWRYEAGDRGPRPLVMAQTFEFQPFNNENRFQLGSCFSRIASRCQSGAASGQVIYVNTDPVPKEQELVTLEG